MKGPPSTRINDLSIKFIVANVDKKSIVYTQAKFVEIENKEQILQRRKEIETSPEVGRADYGVNSRKC